MTENVVTIRKKKDAILSGPADEFLAERLKDLGLE